jgi:hypothetical protein
VELMAPYTWHGTRVSSLDTSTRAERQLDWFARVVFGLWLITVALIP